MMVLYAVFFCALALWVFIEWTAARRMRRARARLEEMGRKRVGR